MRINFFTEIIYLFRLDFLKKKVERPEDDRDREFKVKPVFVEMSCTASIFHTGMKTVF